MSYKIKNLGYRTDFFFNELSGSVEDRGEYLVAKTHNNPHYFWGNLLLFKDPPNSTDFPKWIKSFNKEFRGMNLYHQTFAWDSINGNKGEIEKFLQAGFKLEESIVLTSKKAIKPSRINSKIEIRALKRADEFERCIDIQVRGAGNYLSKESWQDFYEKSMKEYRRLINQGKGEWYGAFLNGSLCGSLGLFNDGEIGRFQIVSTDINFRRQGVCSTLVYRVSEKALEDDKLKKLVMVADPDYHAARIYESVGFIPNQKQVGLCWWDKEKHQ